MPYYEIHCKKIWNAYIVKEESTVEIVVHNETGYNEQPDITSRFGAEVRSRRCPYVIIAISVVTRTGYNEQIWLDLGARYIRFLL